MDWNFYAPKLKMSVSPQTLFSVLGAMLMVYMAGTVSLQAQNCNPNNPYDQIQSGFHSTAVTRADGTFLVWGERAAPNGTDSCLSPLEVIPANGYTYTGNLLEISLGSDSTNRAQFFVLTSNGLYGWGTTDIVVDTNLKNTTNFGPVLMPTGVSPTDVRKMLATRNALLLLTHSGEVWVSGRNAAIHGMGGVTPGAADNYWGRVTTGATGNPVLSGVVDVRISPAAAFAYTSSGTYYTWGPNTFLGDGGAVVSRDRATPMQPPFTGTPVMLAITCGIRGGMQQPSYYSINPADGNVFAMGNNTNGQLGINNTTDQAGWVNIQVPGGGSNLQGVRFISGNDQDGWLNKSAGAVTLITGDKHLYGVGSNQGMMIGGPANNADYLTPITPAGFTFGVDNPIYVETGGHTSVYVKECSDRYCYVGHRINGSMGDGTYASVTVSAFNCTYTAASVICGASAFDLGDAPASYENGSPASHYYLCTDSLYLGDIPPKSNNGLPPANVPVGADNNYGIGGDIQQGPEEEGVPLIPDYTGGTSYSLDVKVVNATGDTANLYAWVDWNGNGVFEVSEAATLTFASMSGQQTQTLTWTGIDSSEVHCGRNYIRLRLTTDELVDTLAGTLVDERSFGPVTDGEIEDYNLIARFFSIAGPDIYTGILTPLPGGSVITEGTISGIWTPAPGNPGTAVISNATSPDATISDFSTPGPYSFVYTSGNGPLACIDTMSVFFNVKPVAQNDAATVDEGSSVVIDVKANDTDPENRLDSNSVHIIDNPVHGTASVDSTTGEITYTSTPGYTGTDSLTYAICDLTTAPLITLCDTAVVYITINDINIPPVANGDSATTPEDTPVVIPVIANDTDIDGNIVPNSVAMVNLPSHGSVTINALTGEITYTPDANFNGTDTFVYLVCDDGTPLPSLCDTALVTVTVTPVNDSPVANNDTASTGSSTPVVIDVISNDTDIDGNINPATVSVTDGPVNGGSVTVDPVTGTITYTPGPNTCGSDHFTYRVCDDGTPLPALCDTAVVTVTVTDTEAPVITCPASVPAFTASANACGYQVTGTALDATAVDNCGTVTLTHNYYAWANPNSLNGATFPTGTTVVTWTATDAAGNTSACDISVTVQDRTAPSFLNCASGVVYTVSLFPDDCEGGVIWPIPVAMDNCGSATVTQTSGPAPGTLLGVGTYIITYTATDSHSNSDSCSFTINVIDTENPTITCPGNIIGAPTDPGTCHWTSPTGSLSPLLVTGNCAATVSWSVQNPDGSVDTGASDISGYVFVKGQSIVTYTVTETASGQNWNCSFTVNVTDHEAPAISGCPDDTTLSADAGQCGASFSWAVPVASDNCALSSFTSTHAPGSVFPVGTTTVTYTATDSSGNTTGCSFTVRVNDTEAPLVTDCPADLVVSNDSGLCSAVVNWIPPTATDNCDTALGISSDHQPGDVFPAGSTVVTYTFTDAAGNRQVCRFTVTVNDTEAPTNLSCPSDINSCSEYIDWTLPSFSDNCSSILSISSNYTPGSLFPVGSTPVLYTAVDAAGNNSTCSFHVRRSAIHLSAAGQNVQCAGADDGIAAVIVSDAIAPYSFNWNNGSSSDSVWTGLTPGTYTVTVTDAIGCSATISVTITEPEPLRVGIISVSPATCGLEDGTVYIETEGGTEPYSYLWNNGYAGPVLTAGAGNYVLTVTDANSCTDTAHVTLSCDFKVPQLVSANGDGHNDTWVIPGIELYPDAVVELYNRWGNLVYKASPYLNDFAGYSNGMTVIGKQKLPAGTYFYVIVLKKGEKAYQGYIEFTY